MNFCVHKYFFERSDAWRQIHEEELRAQADTMPPDSGIPEGEGTISNYEEFGPIDTRHLSNLNILRQRLIKYLRQSEDGIRPYLNIAVKLVSDLESSLKGSYA